MEKIGNQKIWSYFDGKGNARPAANLTIRAAADDLSNSILLL